MLVSEVISDLTGGVSQKAPRLRHPSRLGSLKNGMVHAARGLLKRPPLIHLSQLSDDPSEYGAGTLVKTFKPDAGSEYKISVADGAISAFDNDLQTGVQVHTPDGVGYLTGTEGYRIVEIQDTLYLLNQGVELAALSDQSAEQINEALVYVRQADFSTTFRLVINGQVITHTTVQGNSPSARDEIDTKYVASKLLDKILNNSVLTIEGTQYGSTLYLSEPDNSDFTIEAEDGLADRGLVLIKESVQDFEELPLKAKDGFVVKVTGAPGQEDDDFWVQFQAGTRPDSEGEWVEVAKPGTRVKLDSSTMPHVIEHKGAFEETEAETFPPLPLDDKSGADDQLMSWDRVGNTQQATESNISDPTLDQTLEEHTDYLEADVGASYNGQTRIVRTEFNLDTRKVDGGYVQVLFEVQGVAADNQVYPAGNLYENEVAEIEWTVSDPDVISIKLIYSTGQTPETHKRATLTVPGTTNNTLESLHHFEYTSVDLTFRDDFIYPVGWEITVTLDTTDFVYTITGQKETPSEVASGLAADINSDPGFTASSTENVVTAQTSGGIAPAVAKSHGWSKTTHMYSRELDLSPDEFVGYKIKNVTDGSSGSITDSNKRYIKTSGLNGGIRNNFQAGDKIKIVDSGDYFIFREGRWEPREAGDEDSVPFPSFVGWKGKDIFYHEGRFGILSGDTVVLSEAGNIRNFFQQSARFVADNDPIDIASSGRQTADFHTFLPFADAAYVVSEAGPFQLDGQPYLTPRTVSLTFSGAFPNNEECAPVVAGSTAFLVRKTDTGVDVTHLYLRRNLRMGGLDVTEHIPHFVKGTPLEMTVDDTLGMLFLRTDDDSSALYVLSYELGSEGYNILAWSKWVIPSTAEIVGIDAEDGNLTLTTKHADGAYLSEINLKIQPADAGDKTRFIDEVGGAANTTAYDFEAELTPWFWRDQRGNLRITHRLAVHYMELIFSDTTDFTVEITPQGRPTVTTTYDETTPQTDSLRVPVRTSDPVIKITDSTQGRLEINAIGWEGQLYSRARQI